MSRSENGDGSQKESPLEKLLRSAADECIPLACLFEVTYSCNLKCIHCYRTGLTQEPGLPAAEMIEVLEKLARGGVLFITFSGGEPFVRDDFPLLLEKASSSGLVVRVFSNGTRINENTVEVLAGAGVAGVDLSLYGASSKIHDRITRCEGSWQLTLNALKALTGAGIPVVIKTTVMKRNIGEMNELADLAASFGADFSPNAVFSPAVHEKISLAEYMAEDNAIADLALKLPLARPAPAESREASLSSYPCNAGRSSFSVDPSGRIFPCPIFPEPVGDLMVDELGAIWENAAFLNRMRDWKMADFRECSVCACLSTCNPCPALNRLENGDFFDTRGSICRLTRLFACPGGA